MSLLIRSTFERESAQLIGEKAKVGRKFKRNRKAAGASEQVAQGREVEALRPGWLQRVGALMHNQTWIGMWKQTGDRAVMEGGRSEPDGLKRKHWRARMDGIQG